MKTIKNVSRKPLVVPLPQGKKLHLGPHRTGQVSVHDVDHPPFRKLVDAGEIEILGDGNVANPSGGGSNVSVETHGQHAPEVSGHHRGER